jgi:hypothetical protein
MGEGSKYSEPMVSGLSPVLLALACSRSRRSYPRPGLGVLLVLSMAGGSVAGVNPDKASMITDDKSRRFPTNRFMVQRAESVQPRPARHFFHLSILTTSRPHPYRIGRETRGIQYVQRNGEPPQCRHCPSQQGSNYRRYLLGLYCRQHGFCRCSSLHPRLHPKEVPPR